jgi:hypothetical protein
LVKRPPPNLGVYYSTISTNHTAVIQPQVLTSELKLHLDSSSLLVNGGGGSNEHQGKRCMHSLPSVSYSQHGYGFGGSRRRWHDLAHFSDREQASPELHLAGNIILNDSRVCSKVLARKGRQNSLSVRHGAGRPERRFRRRTPAELSSFRCTSQCSCTKDGVRCTNYKV